MFFNGNARYPGHSKLSEQPHAKLSKKTHAIVGQPNCDAHTPGTRLDHMSYLFDEIAI